MLNKKSASKGKILIADDEEIFLASTADLLMDEGFFCDTTKDANVAKEMLFTKAYDLFISDINMPGNMELELIKDLRNTTYGLPVILVTGYPSIQTAIKSTRLSVAGYLLKPVDFDELLEMVNNAIEQYRDQREFFKKRRQHTTSQQPVSSAKIEIADSITEEIGRARFHGTKLVTASDGSKDPYLFDKIVGKSAPMQRVVGIIKKAAPTESNVLITGETGTGKELIARAIHHHSQRKDGNFVPVDCVALPPNLMESELFGFEKGAFTGAIKRKYGLLEYAQKGTLFLDEISELDVNLQAKLLRVLQERQFRRIGGNKLIDADVRVIAAMNQNPKKVIAAGKLREDLFYRLNVIPIHIPPLRKHNEDIPVLVNHFLQIVAKRYGLEPKKIMPEAMTLLQIYRWPGNVRQLKNVIERVISLSTGTIIEEKDLTQSVQNDGLESANSIISLPLHEARKKKLLAFEKRYMRELMSACNNNIEQAAIMAGISTRTIYRMIEKYGKP